jgi:hypothetical protein
LIADDCGLPRFRVTLVEIPSAEVVGMIGNDQEVQRSRKANAPGGCGIDLLAAGETVSLVEAEAIAEGAGIRSRFRPSKRLSLEGSRYMSELKKSAGGQILRG